MSIEAKVLCDSITPKGKRITTFQVRYPRFIHGEVMTHRVFSRNASSSRAIPVARVIADIRKDPAMPVHWGKNQSGMQAREELSGWRLKAMKALWLGGMYTMTTLAGLANRLGAHKQIVNRMIEPWSHINVVITTTQVSNFFALRSHPDAQPEIKMLSDLMKAAYEASTPKLLKEGEWHLPYIRAADRQKAEDLIGYSVDELHRFKTVNHVEIDLVTHILIGVSIARCARTSYTLHDGAPTNFEKDFGLYERLLGSEPLHASPAEHQATPDDDDALVQYHGNLDGFVQYRKLLVGECQ